MSLSYEPGLQIKSNGTVAACPLVSIRRCYRNERSQSHVGDRFLWRPRVLNLMHLANLVEATSQTVPTELDALERHATGARQALEIGTYQGVSAAKIAAAISAGRLSVLR